MKASEERLLPGPVRAYGRGRGIGLVRRVFEVTRGEAQNKSVGVSDHHEGLGHGQCPTLALRDAQ